MCLGKQRWINNGTANQLFANDVSLADCGIRREYITMVDNFYGGLTFVQF